MGHTFLQAVDFCLKQIIAKEITSNNGLVVGRTGLLLFLYYLFYLDKKINYREEMYDTIDNIMLQDIDDYSLGYGIASLAWVLEITDQQELLGEQADEIDVILERECRLMIEKNNLDYYSGALGILFYFSQKKVPYHNWDLLVEILIQKVDSNLEKGDWYTSMSELDGGMAQEINLGTPHGITGVLLFLLSIRDKIKFSIDLVIVKLCDSLLSFCSGSFGGGKIPCKILKDGKKYSRGIAWCYGDLMGGYALLKSGILLSNGHYVTFAEDMLNHIVNKSNLREEELCLCHGCPSLSHVYQNLFYLTRKPIYQFASNYWKEKTINVFNSHWIEYQDQQKHKEFFENPSLFMGVSGLFLSLISWEIGEEKWIKCLLI